MIVVHVYIHVKPGCEEAFRRASEENASQSVKEPGIVRFDVLQQSDDPARFVLVEIYRDAAAPGLHKETAHYKKWRDAVESMMAEPRKSAKYTNVYPSDHEWR
ncbi:MAG: putative quinol monooxygenase [Verrucomicrobiae bacterium]|nr:putative quinol monooxygenase [Verrucomicrobiae bacterium]